MEKREWEQGEWEQEEGEQEKWEQEECGLYRTIKKKKSDFKSVGSQFIQHYYNVFDQERAKLGDLYTNDSMLTYDGEQFKGRESIVTKYVGLPSIAHKVETEEY